MKKIFLITYTILLVFTLAACNNEIQNEHVEIGDSNIEQVEFKTNLEGIYNAIIAAQPEEKQKELILFPETNEDLINSYYEGLKDIELEEKNFYMHPVGYACEIALVKANSIEDVEKIKNIFEARIQKGIDFAMCDSESQDFWKRRAEIQTREKYVCLIVLPDGYNIPQEIFSLEINQTSDVENEKTIDFKTKYEEKINTLEVMDMYSEYALYDLDEDSIPEMIVKSGMSEADTKITIYDVINDELVETNIKEFGGHTNIVGAQDINTIVLQYGQMGYERVGILHYNQDATYTTEIVKEADTDPQIGYIPFEPLKMYSFEDKAGLEWKQNPNDENYLLIDSITSEV